MMKWRVKGQADKLSKREHVGHCGRDTTLMIPVHRISDKKTPDHPGLAFAVYWFIGVFVMTNNEYTNNFSYWISS